MTTVPLLEIEGLSVRYASRTVLDGVSLQVARGSIYVLLGRNGVGKSSLVRCALGHQRATAGRALLFGTDAWTGRAKAMERVGVVPEEPDAPPGMTALEILRFCAALYPFFDTEGATGRLRRLGVPLDRAFASLSKGQQGSVMLAVALAPRPELLILDDPTLGLDAVARRALYDELIIELSERGVGVLVTTHDLRGIESLATRVGILRQTRLAVDEDLDALKTRYRRLRCPIHEAGFEPFETARVSLHSWGLEAIVANFDEERLRAFQARTRMSDVEVGSLDLENVFIAIAGEEAP